MSEESASPSDHLGPGTGRGSSTSRRTSPGKEKATPPEQDVSSSSKISAPKDLEFITAGHPSQFKDKKTMKKVRSVVMTDYVSKNESRRSATTPTRGTATKSRASKKPRNLSPETISRPQPSITSAPDYSRISPSITLPVHQAWQTFGPGSISPGALIVQSPSSQSTSSNDSISSLAHKQRVHRRYQQTLDMLLGQHSLSDLRTRSELIEFATRRFFDEERRQPTPLAHFLGASLDPFRTMPQSSSRKVNVPKLKYSCNKAPILQIHPFKHG